MTDFRLLNILIVIAEERSVTRAAERMNVSQPALSTSLRRLREMIGDPLFVRAGKELVLTDRAQSVLEKAKQITLMLEAITAGNRSFNPTSDSLVLNIEASEYTHSTILPRLMPIVIQEAPHTQINVRPIDFAASGRHCKKARSTSQSCLST